MCDWQGTGREVHRVSEGRDGIMSGEELQATLASIAWVGFVLGGSMAVCGSVVGSLIGDAIGQWLSETPWGRALDRRMEARWRRLEDEASQL
jgi:phage tail tape-measure protein